MSSLAKLVYKDGSNKGNSFSQVCESDDESEEEELEIVAK
jgi:hypothetical protein